MSFHHSDIDGPLSRWSLGSPTPAWTVLWPSSWIRAVAPAPRRLTSSSSLLLLGLVPLAAHAVIVGGLVQVVLLTGALLGVLWISLSLPPTPRSVRVRIRRLSRAIRATPDPDLLDLPAALLLDPVLNSAGLPLRLFSTRPTALGPGLLEQRSAAERLAAELGPNSSLSLGELAVLTRSALAPSRAPALGRTIPPSAAAPQT